MAILGWYLLRLLSKTDNMPPLLTPTIPLSITLKFLPVSFLFRASSRKRGYCPAVVESPRHIILYEPPFLNEAVFRLSCRDENIKPCIRNPISKITIENNKPHTVAIIFCQKNTRVLCELSI